LQRNAHEQTIICRQLFAVPSANQNDGKNNMNDNCFYCFVCFGTNKQKTWFKHGVI
jgi:hypothetical protein